VAAGLPKRYLVIRQADLRRHPASQRQMSLTDEIRPSRREVPRKNCGRSSGPTKSELLHFPALLLGVSIEIALIEIAFERIRKPDFHRGRHDDVATRLSLKFFARESQKTLMQGVLRANVRSFILSLR
jgi:hypothetical protein